MKKHLLYLTISITALYAQAQAPKLVAMTSEGGVPNGAGTIIQYKGGSDTIAQQTVFTTGNPQNVTLIQAPNGKMYGAVDDGAAADFDAIVEYDYLTHTYTTLAHFNSVTGTAPGGELLLVGDSTFYGMAITGGANASGTIFSYTIGDTMAVKLFDMPANAYPYGSLIKATDGNLYGMTENDGAHHSGTIFSYNLNTSAYNVLVNLPSYAHPMGNLLETSPGVMYGITGGDSVNGGACLFKFETAGNLYLPLFYFKGSHAEASLIKATDGQLYGITVDGGIYSTGIYNGGMLFSYNLTSGIPDTLHNFGNGTDGGYPLTGLYQASDGIIYGMTNEGGTANSGTIFQYNINTHTYALNTSLTTVTGYFPGYGHFTEYTPQAAPVHIVIQPQAANACAGSTVSFIASATGANSVIWQQSVDSGIVFTTIAGATDTAYSFTATGAEWGYQYRAIFTGGSGSDTTTAATLTVTSINDSATVNGATCSAVQTGAEYQWLLCNNEQFISGALSQTYTAPANGSYQCVVQLQGCADTTNCVTVTGVGIAELPQYNFNIYPNPTTGWFVIDHNYTGAVTIQIFNLLGECVKQYHITSAQAQFDINSLAAGIYQLQITDDKQQLQVIKLVKE